MPCITMVKLLTYFFKTGQRLSLLRNYSNKGESGEIVTEKLKIHGVVCRELIVGNDVSNGEINQQQS